MAWMIATNARIVVIRDRWIPFTLILLNCTPAKANRSTLRITIAAVFSVAVPEPRVGSVTELAPTLPSATTAGVAPGYCQEGAPAELGGRTWDAHDRAGDGRDGTGAAPGDAVD